MKRFQVTVKRMVIVYAEGEDEAGAKAVKHICAGGDATADRAENVEVLEVALMVPVEGEANTEVVDVSPAMQRT